MKPKIRNAPLRDAVRDVLTARRTVYAQLDALYAEDGAAGDGGAATRRVKNQLKKLAAGAAVVVDAGEFAAALSRAEGGRQRPEVAAAQRDGTEFLIDGDGNWTAL
jgi:hypothetical protein